MIDVRETYILTTRYILVQLSDLRAFFLLLIQAPIIGYSISLIWDQGKSQLYFIMIVSCVWFGVINACREIIKEKDIYIRERIFGLNPSSYILSKIIVLLMVCFIQCAILILVVSCNVRLTCNVRYLFVILVLCSLGGVNLGLIISSFVNSSEKALALAPIITIPQIMFSKVLEPEISGWAAIVEKAMIVKWGFDAVSEITLGKSRVFELGKPLVILVGYSIAYYLLTLLLLRREV